MFADLEMEIFTAYSDPFKQNCGLGQSHAEQLIVLMKIINYIY